VSSKEFFPDFLCDHLLRCDHLLCDHLRLLSRRPLSASAIL